ncbi:BTB/POZ domain-containing protein 19-like [Anopheles nili]|uniref:BTB/POZ domain-containing protein 19-like n=1 Tax=Anopheles nili TaxID=185578 RepID=UPI00237BBE8C|nr:BTB/POZ domain-containing protein 19-like [Anopheles nili]
MDSCIIPWMNSRPSCLSYGTDDTICSRQQALVNNAFGSDVVFIVGPAQQRIFAHKIYLTIASEYFYVLFYGNFDEASNDEVVLKDDDPELFLLVLQFIYSKHMEPTVDNVSYLFDSARKYMLPELTELLGQFVAERLTSSSVLEIFNDNGQYGSARLDHSCLSMIRDNPLLYFNSEDFKLLEMNRLRLILRQNKVNCTVNQLQNALDKWAAANINEDVRKLRMVLKDSVNFKNDNSRINTVHIDDAMQYPLEKRKDTFKH